MALHSAVPVETIIARLEDAITTTMAAHGIPGASVALLRDGALAWTGGYGLTRAGDGDAVTADTLFEAASLTKPLFAFAVLKLAARGVLDLDRPLIRYLPAEQQAADLLFERVVNGPQLQAITARHVLSHNTGFPNWSDDEPLRTYFQPGTRFSYSGEGFMYLARVLEQITGQAAAALVQAEALDPLGMTHSRLTWSGDGSLPVAQGHNREGEAQEKRAWEFNAAASLHCTAADYARLVSAVLRPDASGPGAAAIAEMLRPQIAVNDSFPWQDDWPRETITLHEQLAWGLGWGLQQTADGLACWHWGDNFTFRDYVVAYPGAGLGVVVLSNATAGFQLWRPLAVAATSGAQPALDWLNYE